MSRVISKALNWFGKPYLVEFDYRDRAGMHHGRCYVRLLFSGDQRLTRLLSSFGYRNIHIY